ncbi:tyrosine-type recombinase/integrase [Cellulomonas septica]|uniref:Site-specific integrase n=1 Tax=Cellulomonas septica TaxID=285080 RepID=A0ABX1JUF9_9CELL|nr:site-specific integrase [Cellulomonas septica]
MPRSRLGVGAFGEISTQQTPGGRFRARVRYRDGHGRYRQLESTGGSRAEARRRLQLKMSTVSDELEPTGEITGGTAFADLVAYWLAALEAEGELAISTRERYAWEAEHLLLPAFRNFTVREITVARVERWLTQQRAFSYARAVHSKKILSLVMGLAVRLEAVDRNPVQATRRLKRPARPPMALEAVELDVIRDAVASWRRNETSVGPRPDGQLEAIIEVMVGTSARIGEALALRMCDLDLDAEPPTIRIAGTIVSPKSRPTYRQDHPKSARSVRRVAVPSFTVEAVLSRLAVTGPLQQDHLVFFSRNNTPLTTANVRRRLRDALQSAGVATVTPHAFRRTAATVVDKHGGLDLAAELLGHTSTAITRLHYIQPDEQVDARTAEILEHLAPGSGRHAKTIPR